jgi:hypothetical protein
MKEINSDLPNCETKGEHVAAALYTYSEDES